jgi:subtilisin family serine protease
MKKLFLFFAAAIAVSAYGQKTDAAAKAPANWFNLSYSTDHVHGVGTERTYTDLVKGKTPDTVIVAVIDGGVDYMHEDLKDVMWHNPKEVPGNGIDDDKNGYVDDIYGWNFIGGKDGKNVQYDNLEMVRLYRPLYKKYKNRDATSITPSEKPEYDRYLSLKADYDKELKQWQGLQNQMTMLKSYIRDIRNQANKDTATYEAFQAFQPGERYKRLHMIIKMMMKTPEDWANFQTEVNEGSVEVNNHLDYALNLDYDSRDIVGDNYEDLTERYYGNPDVKGPDALHGTHVAGIIAANRMNNIGILGVNTAVKIMAVRVVPNGDERDKDVANGIRYAVDNGAKIINMSFGKGYSYNKGIVDDAVRYAESKGVLLIHAAGNDNKDNDHTGNYPNPRYESGGVATNWIEVGALSWKDGKNLVAPFSNYGQTTVNVFAPGVDINSCKSNGGYLDESGTSMASPVTAGVAAFLKCYYPNLTPAQIKMIIEQSTDKSMAKKKVIKPGEKKKKIRFKKLSTSGGMVDLYAAFKMAETVK